jgi:hypothetical protein
MWPVRDKRLLLGGGLIAKRFTMVDGLCAIQILQRPSAGGGSYVLVDTVVRKRGLIAKALGKNLRSGKKRAVELSSDNDIVLDGGSKDR